MKTRTLLLSMAALLAACSNSNEMRRVDLRSAAKDLESIAAQGQLFAEFVMGRHATASYAETYPRYLLQLADEASKKLNETRPEEITRHHSWHHDRAWRLRGSWPDC